jgi:hypothetical protein
MAATISEILDDLSDYSDYEEVGSVDRAKRFITAARRFIALPSSQSDQGSAMGYTPAVMQQELAYARQYVAANQAATSASSSVRFLSAAEGFRR